jgi:hypothetical protein
MKKSLRGVPFSGYARVFTFIRSYVSCLSLGFPDQWLTCMRWGAARGGHFPNTYKTRKQYSNMPSNQNAVNAALSQIWVVW